MPAPTPGSPPRRPLGATDLRISPVAMGCWPISGVTSINVTEDHSLATLKAAVDAGINFFDTAYIYGYEGESERLVGQALAPMRNDVVIATKTGMHWDANRKQAKDARPATIHRQCRESLQRLQVDVIDLYYLHAPDPDVPLTESAGALRQLLDQGLIRAVGVSNFTSLDQFEPFHAVCPISASQPPYNMLQRKIEQDQLPWCRAHDVSVIVYWPLMKGLLAGKLQRNHVWEPNDGRRNNPVFMEPEWTKTHDFLDEIRPITAELGCTLAQLVTAWTIQQPEITAALCGAKRPEQIEETAVAMSLTISADQLARIEAAIERRGPVALP